MLRRDAFVLQYKLVLFQKKHYQSWKRNKIADASWYGLRTKIEYVAAKSGKIVLAIDPKKTSQTCIACSHVDAASRDGEKFVCTNCGHVDDANLQAARNIKAKAVNQYGLMLKQRKKVRQDLPKPRQLLLFETPIPELTGNNRRQHRAHKGKRDVPGNLGLQLSLFNQDNNIPTGIRCESPDF